MALVHVPTDVSGKCTPIQMCELPSEEIYNEPPSKMSLFRNPIGSCNPMLRQLANLER